MPGSSPPVTIDPPGSKSHTQRALLLAALAHGRSEILAPLDCDDTAHLRRALEALGASIQDGPDGWIIQGGRLRAPGEHIHCGEGGTTLRFLAALALLTPGCLVLDGSEGLSRRSLLPLLQAAEALGLRWDSLRPSRVARPGAGRGQPTRGASTSCLLPIRLCGPRRGGSPGERPASISVDASHSSQFASALLMVGPLLPGGLSLRLASVRDPGRGGTEAPRVVSRPYLDMTISVMGSFGVYARSRGRRYLVPAASYRPARIHIERDWSAAAFLLTAAWLVGRKIVLPGLSEQSPQGDKAVVSFLEQLDTPGPRVFQLGDCPDLLPPLAVACLFARGPTRIRGVAHARGKESDRVAVLASELSRAGHHVEQRGDGLLIRPGGSMPAVALDPHGDHRMAMAFGLLSLRNPRVAVMDRQCVAKSYPAFWEDLRAIQ